MKTRKTFAGRLARFASTGLLAAAAVTILAGSTIAPAFADEGRRGHSEWREHEGREHEGREHERFEYRRPVVVAPRFGYAVPGYYGYALAPAVPSLNLDFSFR